MSKSITQVNYDELQRISKSLQNESEEIIHLHSATRQKVEALRGGWTGEAANAFFREQEGQLLPAVLKVSRALNESEVVLNQILQIIHAADEETAGYFKDVTGSTGSDSLLSTLLNLYGANRSVADTLDSLIGNHGGTSGQLGGSGIEDFLKLIKDGWSFGEGLELLKKTGLSKGVLAFADFAFGMYDDLGKGMDLGKAIGVNSLNTGALLVLDFYLPEVMLVNTGVQFLGGLQVISEKFLYGLATDDATRQMLLDEVELKSQSLEKMDLGHITHSLSETIVDAFIAPQNIGGDLLNTLKSTVNVLDGASELILDNNIFTPISESAAAADWVIQQMPVSDEFKRISTAVTRQQVQTARDFMQGFFNLIEWR
jgi:WXG100 family type VII secretion target